MRHVFAGTSSQARRAFRLCLAALIDSVSPRNALSIFSLASTAACCPLATVAARATLSSFSEVSVQDYPGLVHFTEADLLALLSSDDLTVESEVFVFNALVAWVEYDLADRLTGFVGKLATTVRLGQMSIQELAFLDSHPLVSGDRLAVALVANAYLCKLMNIPYENPFGMEGIASGHRRSAGSSGSNNSSNDNDNYNNDSEMIAVEEAGVLMNDILPSGARSSVEGKIGEAGPLSPTSSMATSVSKLAGHVHRSALETVICALRTIQNSQTAAAVVEAKALLHSKAKQQQDDLEEAVTCFGALSVDRKRPSPAMALFADAISPSADAAIAITSTTPVRNTSSSTASMMAGLLDNMSVSPTTLQPNHQEVQQQQSSGRCNLFPVSNQGDGNFAGLQSSKEGISGADNNKNSGVLDNKENIGPNNNNAVMSPGLSPIVELKLQVRGGIAVEQLLSPHGGMKQFQNRGGETQNQPCAENWQSRRGLRF
jgi:hypothetical protein